MKTLFATIVLSATLLIGCNGLGRDSDDPGTASGNDTMEFQTHGIDVYEDATDGGEIGTSPDTPMGHQNLTIDSIDDNIQEQP